MGLKNHQYDTILRLFDARRLQSRYALDKRTEEVYNKCPEIMDIDNRIAEESVRCAKLAVLGNPSALDGLREANQALVREKERILVKHGFPVWYLTPQYYCETCHDTGFVNGERCTCFKAALTDLIYAESNIRDVIERENFDHFDFSLYSDDPADMDPFMHLTPYQNIVRIVDRAKAFTENFDTTYCNLLIYGNTGVGKTFLSNCIARELLESGHTVMYYTAFRFFSYLEKCKFRYNDEDDNEVISQEYLLDCDLLIIDDLGTELTNSFYASALFSVINERQLRRKSTIISTNLSFEQLEDRYSERVFSRLNKDYVFLKLIGKDIRYM